MDFLSHRSHNKDRKNLLRLNKSLIRPFETPSARYFKAPPPETFINTVCYTKKNL